MSLESRSDLRVIGERAPVRHSCPAVNGLDIIFEVEGIHPCRFPTTGNAPHPYLVLSPVRLDPDCDLLSIAAVFAVGAPAFGECKAERMAWAVQSNLPGSDLASFVIPECCDDVVHAD